MKKTRVLLIIAACVLLLLCVLQFDSIAGWVVGLISKETARRRAMPDTGTYLCEECDTQIIVPYGNLIFVYVSGETESINIDYGNNLHGSGSDLYGSIFWNQKKDEIQVVIEKGNEYLMPATEHHFTKVG